MVCRAGENSRLCLIRDTTHGRKKPITTETLTLYESTCVKDLYKLIEEHCHFQPETFKLYMFVGGTLLDLSEVKNKTMSEVGVDFSSGADLNEGKLALIVADSADVYTRLYSEYGLSPASSHYPSSLTETETVNFKSHNRSETGYVGLVNQAMTCYLNSLLQALYMTPEFRNALYNWEYVGGSEKDEASSMPYQLQKLFLNLQTSTKSAVETISLTKSFGWDSAEAWQQHDIQELCRVMFDALERKFKNTEQADLINRLYEGKMIDYVKCLECGTEKTREDTFLDIPLPIRPFGSNVAYNSVEEAIRAFVQYETLEGANQYFCEKCNKKCDAHKGLKFTKFPYLLTLHLKRFDFDYNTCHRIKLNDKVTFPDVLNLNGIKADDEEIGVKNEETSTTSSGAVEDDSVPPDNNISYSNHSTNHDPDDDEGIDMSNGPSTSNCSSHNHENEKHHNNYSSPKGPYQYELFSIMIHSGSASGGHYYAYIKDFRTQEWLCFNDQSVTPITHDDIQKTYGGGPTRAYYMAAYSSSTNAYMLMYRQIDRTRNALPMQIQDFPPHIQALLKKMKEGEDNDRKNREKPQPITRRTVYCQRPTEDKLVGVQLFIWPDMTWAQATDQAYRKLGLDAVVNFDQCRLVCYDLAIGLVECSYDGKEDELFSNLFYHRKRVELLLEIRQKDEKFEPYQSGAVATKVFVVDTEKEEIVQGPIDVRAVLTQTVGEYKQVLGKIINIDPKDMRLVLQNFADVMPLNNDDGDLQSERFLKVNRIFVCAIPEADRYSPFHETAFVDLVQNFDHIISITVFLPDTSKETLENMNIPSLESNCKDKEKPISNGPSKLPANDTHRDTNSKSNDALILVKNSDNSCTRNLSPQLGEGEEWNLTLFQETPEQSNSEDSSLSDSDKTLIGDDPEDDDFAMSYLPSNQFVAFHRIAIEKWDRDKRQKRLVEDDSEYYFKATPSANESRQTLSVLVDKRMRLSTFKKDLEQFVGVPVEYFKMFRQTNEVNDYECSCLHEKVYFSFDDGDKLNIKLGRALRSGEFKVKIYQLLINSPEPYKFLCECVISKDMTAAQAKVDILAEIKRKCNVDIPYDRCRLRKKNYKTASKVYLDDQTFEELRFYSHYEMFVQELPDKETVTNSDQVVLFVKKWSPSRLQLCQVQEIVMDGKSIEELKKKISSISDIPEEHIDIAKGRGPFPCDMSVLRVQNDHDWNDPVTLAGLSSNLEDGFVLLYRDNREKPKQLSHEEVKEIASKESSRLIPLSTTSSYSPRRERALKIHLDSK